MTAAKITGAGRSVDGNRRRQRTRFSPPPQIPGPDPFDPQHLGSCLVAAGVGYAVVKLGAWLAGTLNPAALFAAFCCTAAVVLVWGALRGDV